MVEHLSGYAARDHEVVDYRMERLPGTDLYFRGPIPKDLRPGNYLVCLGAAQTFGCLVERPFPVLLGEQVGLPVVNLGYGGAGARFFVRHAELRPLLNDAGLVVVQVMSGRSVDTRRYDSGGLEFLTRRRDGVRMSAEAAWHEMLHGRRRWAGWHLPRVVRQRVVDPLDRVISRVLTARMVREARRQWVEDYRALFGMLSVPTLFFWFSRRSPDYRESYANVQKLFGEFPQLVNREMVEAIRPMARGYVECVTSRGTPHVLRSRFTGLPVEIDPGRDRPDLGGRTYGEDSYYPSPEMHEDAAQALEESVRSLLA